MLRLIFFLMIRLPLRSTLFPYTTLFRSLKMRGVRSDALLVNRKTGERLTRRRSEEHTSELQSLRHLVCRLLLEKKKLTLEFKYSISQLTYVLCARKVYRDAVLGRGISLF